MLPEDWDPHDLEAELRRRADDEARREAEEVERLVELQRLRRRGLGEAAAEIMARGDIVRVEWGGQAFTGPIAVAHGDLLTLVTSESEVDVNLQTGVLIRVVESMRIGGADRPSGSRSFRARLSEYEQTGEPITLVLSPHGGRLNGRLRVVAADHVVFWDDDRHDLYVPLGTIGGVVRPRRGPQPAV